MKYNYETGGQVQGQVWARKLCGKSGDGRVKWARRNMVSLEGCSFCPPHPWLPQHPSQSWKIKGFRGAGSHAPIPTLHSSEFCRCRLFAGLNSTYLLSLDSEPPHPSPRCLGRAGARKGRGQKLIYQFYWLCGFTTLIMRHTAIDKAKLPAHGTLNSRRGRVRQSTIDRH